MYYIEVAMGQYSGSGPVKMWDCAPLCRGVGIGITVIASLACIYYNIIIAYSIFYINMSFQGISEQNIGHF